MNTGQHVYLLRGVVTKLSVDQRISTVTQRTYKATAIYMPVC